MAPPTPPARPRRLGLSEVRRRGVITELLFLFACTTDEPTQLRPIAEQLGLTVQAASHVYRQLQSRGLAQQVDGRYRPTVTGVAWLHAALGELRDDLQERMARLNVVRRTRALAAGDLTAGEPAVLSLEEGLLTARRGTGPGSRGRIRSSARRGELVEVDELEGILPITPGTVRVLVVPSRRLAERGLGGALRSALGSREGGVLAAQGLEAVQLLRRLTDRPVVRFAVAEACREASRVGVPSTVVVLDEQLPHLLERFQGQDAPPLAVTTVG